MSDRLFAACCLGTDTQHAAYEPCPLECTRCGEADYSPNLEAYEVTGELVCDDCAEEVLFDHGPFGVGA